MYRSWWKRAALALVLCLGCSAAPGGYTQAIVDSTVFDPANVHPLRAIPAGAPSVTVVTWATRITADRYYALGAGAVGVDVWVTLDGDVRERCGAFPSDPAAQRLRLQQLLGLPAAAEDRMFVVMRAESKDVFRPCPDPDPTRAACDASFPAGVDVTHKAWLAEQMVARYKRYEGYPWTRLGYTLDWAPGGPKAGASEFVLRRGSRIDVLAKVDTADYCRR
jgi:hypothetical protein